MIVLSVLLLFVLASLKGLDVQRYFVMKYLNQESHVVSVALATFGLLVVALESILPAFLIYRAEQNYDPSVVTLINHWCVLFVLVEVSAAVWFFAQSGILKACWESRMVKARLLGMFDGYNVRTSFVVQNVTTHATYFGSKEFPAYRELWRDSEKQEKHICIDSSRSTKQIKIFLSEMNNTEEKVLEKLPLNVMYTNTKRGLFSNAQVSGNGNLDAEALLKTEYEEDGETKTLGRQWYVADVHFVTHLKRGPLSIARVSLRMSLQNYKS